MASSNTDGKSKKFTPPSDYTPQPVSTLPERYLLDLATKCNLRCPMCPVWGSPDNDAQETVKGVMDLEKSKQLLDEMMKDSAMLQPNLYGEPLVAPFFKEQVIEMKKRGLSVAFNTNGLTLDREIAQFLVDNEVGSIFFSIDAVTPDTLKKIRGIRKLSRIEESVHLMLEVRGKNKFPRIGVSFTEQPENEHETQAFVDKWTHVVDCVRVGLIFENGTFPNMPDPGPRKPCPALYNTMPIHNDGQVTLCCLDGFKQTNMGNVFTDGGIEAVWNGDAFKEARYYHETEQWDKVPFCTNCNGWAQYEFEDEIKDGLLIRRSPQYTYYNEISMLENWDEQFLGGHTKPDIDEETKSKHQKPLKSVTVNKELPIMSEE